jgi:outer membrane receptor protein involved in Fe transport
VDIVDYAGGFVNYKASPTNGRNGNSYAKLNGAFQFTPDMLGYLTYSEGFRRGGTNGFRNVGTRVLAPDAREYFPDSTENYELGLKGYLFNRQLYLETALYKIDWKNTQTYRSQDINGFPVNGTANGPDAVSKGWEFAARWRLSPAWQLTYSTTTVEAKWKDTKTHCLFTNGTTCRTWTAGGLLGGAPKWKHNLAVRFQHSFDNDVYVWTSLSARYQGPVQVDRADSPTANAGIAKYESLTRYNFSAGLEKGPWSGSLWVSNLTNERAIVSVQAAGVMGPREISPQFRTMGVNLGYRF